MNDVPASSCVQSHTRNHDFACREWVAVIGRNFAESLSVKLEPETTYAVWLNAGRFMSFMDPAGNASVPYLLVFRTGKAK